jgi:transcriptional regulator with GAF, ATPase, and Fis domain
VPASGTISIDAVGDRAKRLCDHAAARLRKHGLHTRFAADRASCEAHVVFFDGPDGPVLDLLHALNANRQGCLLAIATEQSRLGDGAPWKLLTAGASDVFAYDDSPEWPARVDARVNRWREIEQLVASRTVQSVLIGQSRRWVAAVRDAVQAARFTDAPIILMGESGTGKELVARMIHSLDPRPRKGDLVVLDCTTIVPTLSGSEFFGHERGAFTGATAAREGAFGLANGGTLFLDEVGELPLPLQSELLRVVQEGVYKPVGANNWRTTSFRLVCATNRDLFAEAAAGRFRYDLLYRLAGSVLHLPSLEERRDDILSLARYFLSDNGDGKRPDFDQDVAAFLVGRSYPGNVRELRQLMARIAYRHVGPGPITVGDVPPDEWDGGGAEPPPAQYGFVEVVREAVARGLTLREIAAAAGDVAVAVALDQEGGSVKRAAARLGVTPRALQMRRANGRGLPPPGG